MGVVFRALDRQTGQEVALKRVLRPAGDRSLPLRSDAEATAAVQATDLQTAGSVPLDVPIAHGQALPLGAQSLLGTDTAMSMAQDQLGLALGREFRTLASLRHPNIISVRD